MTHMAELSSLPEQPAALLAFLAQRGVSLTLEGENLRLSAAKGALTPELQDHLARRKPAVLAYLQGIERAGNRITPRHPRPTQIPLSFAQSRLWFLDQLTGGGPTYNISSALEIEGPLQHSALQAALNALVDRHEVLRTTFAADHGLPHQVIARQVAFSLPLVDLSHLDGAALVQARQDALTACLSQSFDLSRDPMIKATLIRLGAGHWLLVLLLHHIAGDGWSIGILTRELAQLYAQLSAGQAHDLPSLPLHYADFALWQREVLTGPALDAQLEFWRNQLRDAPPLLLLPTDRPRPDRQSFAGAHAVFTLPAGLTGQLRALARKLETTLYSVLMAGFASLLYRYSGQDDIVIGSPIANRNRRELEPLVGFFVNTLALRLRSLSDDLPFASLVAQHSATARDAFDHQDMPFERVVDDLAPDRDQAHAPVFQTAFALQNAPRSALELAGLTLRPVPLDNGTSKFDIFLSVEEQEDHLRCTWEYATDLFDTATIAQMADHYQRLLTGAIADPATGIGHLPLLSQAEIDQQLTLFNSPCDPPNSVTPFPDLFRDLATTFADAPALHFNGETLSYAALDRATDSVAAQLIAAGLDHQGAVGILLPRGFGMIIAMLGILKAGGAFVPLDPAYPADRLAYIAQDSGMRLVLSDEDTKNRLDTSDFTILDIAAAPATPDQPPRRQHHAPDDLAYIIYTSGSTGRPKGAINSHAGLGNLAQVVRRIFQAGPGDRALHFASFSFDSSIWEILIPLASGATLYLIPETSRLPDRKFADWLQAARITHATFTPSFLAALPATPLPDLRELVLAGEACPQGLLRTWASGRRIVNAYGPSEAAVCATFAVLDPDRPVTIGRPVHGVQAYVLRGDALLPPGAEGELVIGGLSVGLGYRGRPDLTAAAFAPNPFGPGQIYRTGDKVRYSADGEILFLGRIDHQTKIRGHRIDPGEIEKVLSADAAVQNAVVLAREDRPGEKRLVAYVQPHPLTEDETLDRTGEWQSLFDSVYAPSEIAADPVFDISGWASSFDGSALPAAEMRAWLDDTLATIRSRAPTRVLEIGCGSGLILSQIAPEVAVYDATDISARAVARIQALCDANHALRHVRVERREADDPGPMANGTYDLIILNSVVQYFPSLAYLRRVLARLAPALAAGGAIFFGDIRNLRLAHTLHAAIQAFRAPPHRLAADVAARAAQSLRDDEELYLDPAAFAALIEDIPGLCSAQVFLKDGRYRNELNAFRYQVLLDGRPSASPPLQLNGDGFGLEDILAHLPGQDPILITGLRDARTSADVMLTDWLGPAQTQPISQWNGTADPKAIDPADILDGIGRRGLNVQLLPGPKAGEMQALIYRGSEVPAVAIPPIGPLSNTPLFGKYRRVLVERLRVRLRDSLPEYMMPTAFVVLERLPLTPNGKIDRRALPPPERIAPTATSSPGLPQTPAETALAAIWCAVLRLDSVGRDDNFFEIGGDSISSVQVIAKAREIGLALTPQDIFKNQTVGTLARAALPGERAAVSQESATGTAPATPIQHWFAEHIGFAPHHFNQSIFVALEPDCPPEIVSAAVAALHEMHDALTARFFFGSDGWQMLFGGAPAPKLRVVACDDPEQISRLCAEAQAALDPASGRMSCPILFDRGAAGGLFFWTVHHLVVDVVSWHILQTDFIRACSQLAEGRAIDLGARTLSFADWARATDTATSTWAVQRHLPHWKTTAATPPFVLPTEGSGPDTAALTRTERRILPAVLADRLLTAANATYGTRPQELILAALASALARHSSEPAFRIDLETQGRDGDSDLSRTVGWFTALVPLTITPAPLGTLIPTVKDNVRTSIALPQIHGQLRYLGQTADLQCSPAQLVFNHLGQTGASTEASWPVVGPAPLDPGPIHSPDQRRPYGLQLTTAFADGGLVLALTYGAQCHRAETIATLADAILHDLETVLDHCQSIPERVATLGDFPLASLSSDALALLPHGRDIEDILDATPLQEGMLFECLAAPQAGQYIEQVGFDLQGPLDPAALERAWNGLIARHAILRCGFQLEGQSRARQILHRTALLDLACADLRHLPEDAAKHHVAALRISDRQRGFDFTAPPLMRLHLLQLGPERWHLLWTSHHILMDGWCIKIVFNDLRALYAAERQGLPSPLLPAPDWRDYLRFRQTVDAPAAEAWWRQQLSGFDEPTRLARDTQPGPRRCDHQRIELESQVGAMLQAMARAHRVTLNTLLQGAWSALLAHTTGRSDVVHGTTINGRPPSVPGIEDMVGLFINTLPHRARIDWDIPIADWLLAQHADMAGLDAHGHVSLRDLRGWSDIPRSDGALFDTLFVFENFPFDENLARSPLADDLALTGIETGGETNFPLTAVASLRGQVLSLRLTYDVAAWDAVRVAALAKTYRVLLLGLTENLSRPMRDWLPCTDPGAEPAPQSHALVPTLLAHRLVQSPSDIVLSDGTQHLTVAELDARAAALAGALAAAGHPETAPVALIVDRGINFVVGLLAAWRRRAPFVPVEPAWPPERQAQILTLAQAQFAIGRNLSDLPTTIVPPDAAGAPIPPLPLAADDLAYIIFTSGSTGTPKGVRITQGNLAAYVAGITDRLDLMPGHVFATTSGFGADLGYTALFPALTTGRLHLLPEALVTDAHALAHHLQTHPVDVLKTVPGHFAALLSTENARSLLPRQRLVFGGDRLEAGLVHRIRALRPDLSIFNHYGPTEATIGAICGEVPASPGDFVPLGQPLPGVGVTILGPAGHRLPDGLVGEICLTGATISPGYLGSQPGGFVDDAEGANPAYRTGDLGFVDDQAQVHFMGRRDGQAKIRGFRVEPAEVALCLRGHPLVTDCHVAVHPGAGGGAQLLAWVVGPVEGLRDWVRNRLPDAYVPAQVNSVPSLPRLANGKIDLRALLRTDASRPAARTPQSETEIRLCQIFADVLRRAEVGPDDNFFDLGGDSIVAIQVVARAREAGFRLTTRDVFAHQSPAELALCARAVSNAAAAIQTSGPFQPGPIQARFLRRRDADLSHYNQALLFPSPSPDETVLQQALALITAQHDMLRLRLRGATLQLADLSDAASVAVEVIDLSDCPEPDQPATFAPHAARLQASLDLAAGPIQRVALVRRRAGADPLVLWVIHHLAVDAVSWRILLEDLSTACRQIAAGETPRLPAKAHSFAAWTQHLAAPDRFADELAHWRHASALVTDLPHRDGPDVVGDVRRSEASLTEAETSALSGQPSKIPLLDLIVTALMRALKAITGLHDLRIDLEGHGRATLDPDLDISRTVGWFTAIHPLRVGFPRTAADEPASELTIVRQALGQIPNGGLGYGVLRDMAADPRLGSAPQGAIVLNYLGRLDGGASDHDLKTGPARSPRMVRPYPLEVVAILVDGQLRLLIEHNPDLYSPASIDELRDCILAELRLLTAAGAAPLASIHDFGLSGMSEDDFARLQDLIADEGDRG